MLRILILVIFVSTLGCKDALIYRGIGGNKGKAGGRCEVYGAKTTISNNTGHVMNVSDADVLISAAKTYDITGAAGHSHNVTITVDDFNRLALGLSVTETSTLTLGHTHSVFIECL